MPKKLEHIGIAVKNLEASEALFTKLLGIEPYKREEVSSEGVMTSFFLLGDIKFELLAATNQDSPIAKFIEKRGEGLHHLAFESENIELLSSLVESGKELINFLTNKVHSLAKKEIK
jgi:methylmalonyl-CoA/ethylmalonyl-CoA epimerase